MHTKLNGTKEIKNVFFFCYLGVFGGGGGYWGCGGGIYLVHLLILSSVVQWLSTSTRTRTDPVSNFINHFLFNLKKKYYFVHISLFFFFFISIFNLPAKAVLQHAPDHHSKPSST